MKFLSNEKISQNKYKTAEGYLVCVDSILARTGKQQYMKGEVFKDCEDSDAVIEVDRPYNEVFSPETLASFENKPITFDHPDENVNSTNHNDLSVGFVRDVKKGTVNGQDVMLGTLIITNEDAIESILNGNHTDLSCGYDCDIVDEQNPSQHNIRGNHVALCQEGRAGVAKIVDNNTIVDTKMQDYTSYVGFNGASQLVKDIQNYNGQDKVFSYYLRPKQESAIQFIGAIIHQNDKYLTMFMKQVEYAGDLEGAKRKALETIAEILKEWKKLSYYDSIDVDEIKKLYENSAEDSIMEEYEEFKKNIGEEKAKALEKYLQETNVEFSKVLYNSNEFEKFNKWYNEKYVKDSINDDGCLMSSQSHMANSPDEAMNVLMNGKDNEGLSIIMPGGKFLNINVLYNDNYTYIVWGSGAEKKQFNNASDARNYAKTIIENMQLKFNDDVDKYGEFEYQTTKSGKKVKVYKKAPDNWKVDLDATTAPIGTKWYSNNKSFFSGERESILVKDSTKTENKDSKKCIVTRKGNDIYIQLIKKSKKK